MILLCRAGLLFVLFNLSEAATRIPSPFGISDIEEPSFHPRNGQSNNEPRIESRGSSSFVDDEGKTFMGINDSIEKLQNSALLESKKLGDNVKISLKKALKVESRGKKHQIKKAFLPLLAIIILKAMTVVPLLIGALAVKAWNGLQLSLISFIVASGLAIFQLCQRLVAVDQIPVFVEPPPFSRRSLTDVHTKAFVGYL